MDYTFWDRINAFWTRLGIKPAVGNAFVTGIVGTLAYWIISGDAFDADELRLLVGTFLLGLIGVASPPAVGTVMTKAGPAPRTAARGTTYER
jgi:hypothetical protein